MDQEKITCKTCDKGAMVKASVFRMSTPVVVIGHVLLIPSILGMLACAVPIIFAIIALFAAPREHAGDAFGISLVGGVFVFGFISSMVGGVFGWLLVMRKKILRCVNCGATVDAV